MGEANNNNGMSVISGLTGTTTLTSSSRTPSSNSTPTKKKNGGNGDNQGTPNKFTLLNTNQISKYVVNGEEIKFTLGKNNSKVFLDYKERFIKYIGAEYGGDEKATIEESELTILGVEEPEDYTDAEFKKMKDEDGVHWFKFKKSWDKYDKHRTKIEQNLTIAYTDLWTVCELPLQNKLKSRAGYKQIKRAFDVNGLLGLIEELCNTAEETKYIPLKMVTTNKQLHTCRQNGLPLADFYRIFKMLWKLSKRTGNTYFSEDGIEHAYVYSDCEECKQICNTFDAFTDIVTHVERKAIYPILEAAAEECYAASLFLSNLDGRYQHLRQTLHNAFIKDGVGGYPTSLTAPICR